MPRYPISGREKALSETRQRLMEAAVNEFATKGYANANINQISAAAGFAKGTVYNYFASKQALMLALIEETGKFHLDFIAGEVQKEKAPAARLEQFYAAGFAFIEQYPAQARFLITTLYGTDAEFKMAMYRTYLPMFQLVGQDILAIGITQGVFAEMDPVRTASLLMTIYLGTSSNVDANGKTWMSPAEVAGFALKALRK